MNYKGYKIKYNQKLKTTTIKGFGLKSPKIFENHPEIEGKRIAINFINIILK